MVNPGAFRGSRKDFLVSQKPAYAEAVVGGFAADVLANIQRKYFKRYPVELPHDEEPTPEHLAAVNDDEADPEIEGPDAEKMSPQQYEDAVEALEQRSSVIRFRKAVSISLFIPHFHFLNHVRPPANQEMDGLPIYEGHRRGRDGTQRR